LCPNPIKAELVGDSKALACGFVINSHSPLLGLCRSLVASGYDPATPLEAYRGETLCLRVRSIGEAARLEVNGNGIGFRLGAPDFRDEPRKLLAWNV
jgi:hypothetical protein